MNESISKSRLSELYFLFILGFILNFALWFANDTLTDSVHVCSRFIQNCDDFNPFKGFPHSWDTSLFYESIFLSLVLSVYCFLNGKQRIALNILIYPLAVEALLGFILYENTLIPCIYYNFFPCLILVFSKDYKNDLKWLVPLFYLLASWVKLDSGWLLGKQFSWALGLPLVPGYLLLPVLWLFFFMELTSFALLLNSKRIHKFYLYFYYVAHLYAFIFTGYHFQLMALPLIYFVFQDQSKIHSPSPLFIVCAVYLVTVNILPHITDSNYKITGQGDSLSFDMVDANRQAISRITIFEKDGASKTERKKYQGFTKQNPYKYWMQQKKLCTSTVERISWTFELSVNNDPYIKIVDVPDLCSLKFHPFFKNSWIKAEGI